MHGYFENSLLFSGLDRHLLSFLALLSMKWIVIAAALLYKLFKQLTPTRCKIQINFTTNLVHASIFSQSKNYFILKKAHELSLIQEVRLIEYQKTNE